MESSNVVRYNHNIYMDIKLLDIFETTGVDRPTIIVCFGGLTGVYTCVCTLCIMYGVNCTCNENEVSD